MVKMVYKKSDKNWFDKMIVYNRLLEIKSSIQILNAVCRFLYVIEVLIIIFMDFNITRVSIMIGIISLTFIIYYFWKLKLTKKYDREMYFYNNGKYPDQK